VGPQESWIVPLVEVADCAEELVGGKAAKLAALLRAGFTVPNGFCITTRAYERFLRELAQRVTEDLIPKLEADGARFAAEQLQPYDDRQLARAIQERLDALRHWKEVYFDSVAVRKGQWSDRPQELSVRQVGLPRWP
jgi:rifampicin phosphotransferase